MNNRSYTISQAAKTLGIKRVVLEEQIEEGNIHLDGDFVSAVDMELLKDQKDRYVSLREYLSRHDSERFDSRYVKNRNKYIDFLEDNDYFGIEHVHSDRIYFSLPSEVDLYILREDTDFLDFKSTVFFRDVGL